MHFSAPPVLSSQGKHARTSSQTGLLQGPSKGTVEEESCWPLDTASRRRAENACVLPFGREDLVFLHSCPHMDIIQLLLIGFTIFPVVNIHLSKMEA